MIKILIIEDEDLISKMLLSFFERCGDVCHTLKPETLEEIIKQLKGDYDVILCDYMMPNITGWNIFNTLDDNLKKKFVVITGGFIDYEIEKQLQKSNINIVYKPFDMIELHSVIRKIYESR